MTKPAGRRSSRPTCPYRTYDNIAFDRHGPIDVSRFLAPLRAVGASVLTGQSACSLLDL